MCFSSQKAICCLVDQFEYCLLIGYIKTPAVLKRQRFEDSENKETKPRVSKFQYVDVDDNKEGQSLDEYEDKDEREELGYVPLPFVIPPPP